MIRRTSILALTFALSVGCASREPEYSSQDGARRARADAEEAYARTPSRSDGPQLDKPLKAIYTPFPDYPRDLRNAGVVGSVRTRFTIDEDGKVSSPSVIGSPDPSLASLVLHSVMRWRFEPPLVNGKPTRIGATHEFVFELE